MEWSRAKILSLISSLRQTPALWNHKTVEYANKDYKNKLWDELGAKFGCSRYIIEKKLACLRSQHSRELLKMKRKKRLGIDYESKWFAFNAMEAVRTKSKRSRQPSETQINDDITIEFTTKEEPESDISQTNDPLLLSDDTNDGKTFYDPFNASISENNNEQFDNNQEFESNSRWKNDQIDNSKQKCNQVNDLVIDPEKSTNSEFSNREFTNREVTNREFTNREVTNREFSNREVTNREFSNLPVTNRDVTTREVINRDDTRQDNVSKPKLSIDQELLLNDDLLAFGINVAAQLRNIKNSYSRSAAKLYIQKILFQAETGKI